MVYEVVLPGKPYRLRGLLLMNQVRSKERVHVSQEQSFPIEAYHLRTLYMDMDEKR